MRKNKKLIHWFVQKKQPSICGPISNDVKVIPFFLHPFTYYLFDLIGKILQKLNKIRRILEIHNKSSPSFLNTTLRMTVEIRLLIRFPTFTCHSVFCVY